MCEMLRCLVAKDFPTPEMALQGFQVGDIITIQEDGWPWSAAERANTTWEIVKVPGVSVESQNDLLIGNVAGTFSGEQVTIRRRARYLTTSSEVMTPEELSAAKADKNALQVVVG